MPASRHRFDRGAVLRQHLFLILARLLQCFDKNVLRRGLNDQDRIVLAEDHSVVGGNLADQILRLACIGHRI